jgi:uncharacterized protein YhaN
MKILNLELLAYGPFTRQSLAFSVNGYGLHLIYGPNEAGKSTTLRALRRLLYGIPSSCDDDFIHPAADLRIGAVLEDERGQLACIRRKGNKSAKGNLRAADDETILDASRLDEMLGGLDEDAFCRRFGIDYKELVAGGKQVVAGEGDLGQILFAAASGVADLGEVLRRLDEDEEEIFKPRGSTPPLNKALAELKEAKRRLDKAELSVKTWKAKQDELDVAEEKRKAIEDELRSKQSERKRREAYLLVRPDLTRRAELIKEQSELKGIPLLPAEFSQRRQTAQDELIRARTQVESAERELQSVAAELAGIEIKDELLSEEDSIRTLEQTLGSHKEAMGDRPGLLAERDHLRKDAEQIRRELSGGDVEKLRVRQVERIRIQELASEFAALDVQHQTGRKGLARIEAEIARCTAALQSSLGARESDSLKRLLKRAQPKADLETRLRMLAAEIAQGERKLAAAVARLELWKGDAEELLQLALPPIEAIDRFDGELRTLSTGQAVTAKELEKSERELAELEIDIEHRRRSGQVLALEDLEAARERRSERWSAIKQWWLSGTPPKGVAGAQETKVAAESAAAYEESTAQADEVADRMRREAEQVAHFAELQARRSKLIKRCESLSAQLAEEQSRLAAAQSRWKTLWQPLGFAPLSPAEMRGWLSRIQEILRQAEALVREREEERQLSQTADALRQELKAEMGACGEPALLSDEPLEHLIERAEQLQDRLARAASDRKQWQRQLEAAEAQHDEAARELEQSQGDLAAWKENWRKATAPLGLEEGTSCAQVHLLLSLAESYFTKLRDAEGLEHRITGIDERGERFARMLADLVSRLAPELAGSSADVAVFELRKRFDLNARGAARRDALLAKEQLIRSQLSQTSSQALALEKQLAAMCREAGCDQPDELAAVERQSERRRQIDATLRELEGGFFRYCESLPFDGFISTALSKSTEEWRKELEEFDSQIAELQEKHTEEIKAAQAARSELKTMDGGAAAAEAEEEIQHLLARIRTLAEEYARLKLAGVLLRKAIDSYRDKNQSPVLNRASELFRELTACSFIALQPRFDDKANPVLVGVRPDGDFVPVAGMSDGTCDQLYLALRLATLEMYVREHRAIPFIVDDILINFDDGRAIAALKALAQLARHTQVIFFTHHEHLLTLAEEHLRSGEFFSYRLPGRSTVQIAAQAQSLAVG